MRYVKEEKEKKEDREIYKILEKVIIKQDDIDVILEEGDKIFVAQKGGN